MGYHIDTGLIKEKFKTNCECPLCEIKAIVEEQYLHEFLNDAVMEEETRLKVNKLGFCGEHFEKLFNRQNKLSVALQVSTRVNTLQKIIKPERTIKGAKSQAEKIINSKKTCILCDYIEESMIKYYKTIAQLYNREDSFYDLLRSTKGFCLEHYAMLIKYSGHALLRRREYLAVLTELENKNINRLQKELKSFCDAHDYRNAYLLTKTAETALPRMGEKLYGKRSK